MADLEKQSYEERIFAFDFSGKMSRRADLVSLDSITIEGGTGSPDLDYTLGSVDGKLAQAKFTDGVDGQRYKITFKVTDSDGQKLEGEGYLSVADL